MKFYICSHCGNIIAYVKSSGVPVMGCGEKMQELVANTTDAAVEKHVPVVTVDGQKVTVTVGSAEHPMTPEHYIQWIALATATRLRRFMHTVIFTGFGKHKSVRSSTEDRIFSSAAISGQ